MTIGPFYAGQTPAEPALITVLTPDGIPRDLTGYTATGVLYSPDGSDVSTGSVTVISGPSSGEVQFDWPVPSAFDTAGVYLLQIRLTTADPDILDFTTELDVEVRAALPRDVSHLRVTAEEVEFNTGQVVGAAHIAKAQTVVGLFTARNFADDATWAGVGERDRHWIRLAISHQAAWVKTHPPIDDGLVGASSVKTGDVSVSYSGGVTVEAAHLSPLARMSIQRVAWTGGRTMHATPFLGAATRTPIRPMWSRR